MAGKSTVGVILSSKILSFLLLLLLNHASPYQSHRVASNTIDPDYFAPSGVGGIPQTSGGDGSVVIITSQPTELRSAFFYAGEKASFVVPGSTTSSPYHQVVQVKLWGAGGGGCDGGRLNKLSDSDESSSGLAGGYVEASFNLPMGDTLIVDVGGGGRSRSVRSDTLLGGLGGYNGGKSGYRDRSSGGGGGGGECTCKISVLDLRIASKTAADSSPSCFIQVCRRYHWAMEPFLQLHLEAMGEATQVIALH